VDPADARSWLAAHVVIATMITANARTTTNLNPRLSGACAICSPSWQQTEIGGLWRASRQAHGEHRAFALLARHGHVTAHHARELALCHLFPLMATNRNRRTMARLPAGAR